MKVRPVVTALVLVVAALVALAPLLEAQTGPALGFAPQVFVIGADGTGLRQLTNGNGWRRTPTWSRDGRRLAYAGRAIKVITLATGEARALARSGQLGGNGWVAWSPTRDEILFTYGAGTEDRPRTAIGTLSADGRRFRKLASWKSLRSPLGGPTWSPDGRRIAYLLEGKPLSRGGPLGTVSGGHLDVAVMTRTGKQKRRFRLRGDEWAPLWSPDGRWLLFGRETGRSTTRRSKFGLWRMSPGGSVLQRVGPRLINADPTWSHDSTRVAFSGHTDTGARQQALYVMNVGRQTVPRMVIDEVGASAWSPTGELIAFADFNGGLRVTAPDGSGQRTLATFAPDTEFRNLNWSPDGSRLAFIAEKQRPSD